MAKRDYGEGAITQRGENTWRLRYRIEGKPKRFSLTVQGTRKDAQKKLRELLKSGDDDAHIAPDKITLAEWSEKWLALLARKPSDAQAEQPRKRRRALINPRSLERYSQLMRLYILPTLGYRQLQQIQASELDDLYIALEEKLAARTVQYTHVTLKACLNVAVRKGLLASNPADGAEAPSPAESDVGQVLDAEQLKALVHSFRKSALYPIVAVAAFTGARRNEILALPWTDLDADKRTLRIERAIEETKAFGRTVKEPKTERGKPTITIDDDPIALLLDVRAKHQRIIAGVPDGAPVDLSLIKLPADALMFPSMAGADFDCTRLRGPRAVTHEFCRQVRRRGFPKLRFHDLRGSHETALLDAGVPVHVVASRCGHDPALMLRSYAKRHDTSDTAAAVKIGKLLKGSLGD